MPSPSHRAGHVRGDGHRRAAIAFAAATAADDDAAPPSAAHQADRRRMLELLAASRDGCTESILLAHGFSVPQMVEIINAGLASATGERMVAGRRAIEVARVRITEAGRRTLAEAKR
jgi:hypothetical protein